MSSFIRQGGKMLTAHARVMELMPALLRERGRWSCYEVQNKHGPFKHMRLSYDRGVGSTNKGIELDGERYIVIINNFFRLPVEQPLHNHRGQFASYHFHPDLPIGTPVVRHHWKFDGSDTTDAVDFAIGDSYAIEEYTNLFHRVEPLVDEFFTLLVAVIAKDAREPNVTLVPQRAPEALRMFNIIDRQFAA